MSPKNPEVGNDSTHSNLFSRSGIVANRSINANRQNWPGIPGQCGQILGAPCAVRFFGATKFRGPSSPCMVVRLFSVDHLLYAVDVLSRQQQNLFHVMLLGHLCTRTENHPALSNHAINANRELFDKGVSGQGDNDNRKQYINICEHVQANS